MSASEETNMLPHTVEEETHFGDAMEYLAPDAEAPSVIDLGPQAATDAPEPLSTDAAPSDAPKSPSPDAAPSDAPTATAPVSPSVSGTASGKAKGDWSGVVLVPDMGVLSMAYSSAVSISRVEAHPFVDDRIRVWARIQNETEGILPIRVSCSFRVAGEAAAQRSGFQKITIPEAGHVDARFESLTASVVSYTILVKESTMVRVEGADG